MKASARVMAASVLLLGFAASATTAVAKNKDQEAAEVAGRLNKVVHGSGGTKADCGHFQDAPDPRAASFVSSVGSTAPCTEWVGATPAFCSDPYAAICASQKTNRRGRAARVREALERAMPKALECLKKFPLFDFSGINSADDIDQLPALKKVMAEAAFGVCKAKALDTDSHTHAAIRQYAEKARKLVKDGIDSQLNFDGYMDGKGPSIAADMKKVINGVRVYDPVDAEAAGGDALKEFTARYREKCGPDGLVVNAFATTINGQKSVFLCPGWVLGSKTSDDPNAFADSLIQVLGHEFGHHIDATTGFDDAYDKFLGCLKTHHARPCGKDEDPNEANSECLNGKVDAHKGEITADFWGVQVLRAQFQSVGTEAEGLRILRENYGEFCCSGDEGIHPGGRYRVEVLLRRDPVIHKLMKCNAPANATATCTLDGMHMDRHF